MIVLSVGMPKSGSAYFYNIINALLVEAGNKDAGKIRAKHHLDELMKWRNNFVGILSFRKFIRLWLISLREGTFVVKSHAGPSRMVKIANKLGLLKIVYCYRDPRDVLLSAMDHGKKLKASGDDRFFATMVDFDSTLPHVQEWLDVWKLYAEIPGVLMVKYEDLIDDAVTVTKTIESFLGISISAEKRDDILWSFSKDNPNGYRAGMHLNKAQAQRFKTDMTQEQKTKFLGMFQTNLEVMKYDIE